MFWLWKLFEIEEVVFFVNNYNDVLFSTKIVLYSMMKTISCIWLWTNKMLILIYYHSVVVGTLSNLYLSVYYTTTITKTRKKLKIWRLWFIYRDRYRVYITDFILELMKLNVFVVQNVLTHIQLFLQCTRFCSAKQFASVPNYFSFYI